MISALPSGQNFGKLHELSLLHVEPNLTLTIFPSLALSLPESSLGNGQIPPNTCTYPLKDYLSEGTLLVTT